MKNLSIIFLLKWFQEVIISIRENGIRRDWKNDLDEIAQMGSELLSQNEE
jgi:hypothetical protein